MWRTIYTWYVSFRADNMLDTVRLEQVWTLLPRARILVTNLVNWDICYGIGFDMDGPSNNMAIGGLWHRPETGCNGGEVDHWIRCKCQWQNFGAEYVINMWQTFYSIWTMKWCWLRLFSGYWRFMVSCSFQITQSFRGSPSLFFCDPRRPEMPILNKQARYLDEGEEYWNIFLS